VTRSHGNLVISNLLKSVTTRWQRTNFWGGSDSVPLCLLWLLLVTTLTGFRQDLESYRAVRDTFIQQVRALAEIGFRHFLSFDRTVRSMVSNGHYKRTNWELSNLSHSACTTVLRYTVTSSSPGKYNCLPINIRWADVVHIFMDVTVRITGSHWVLLQNARYRNFSARANSTWGAAQHTQPVLFPAMGEALCYKPEGRGFKWIFYLPNSSGRTKPWSLLSLQQKWVPEA
jgi:hypothetical protein